MTMPLPDAVYALWWISLAVVVLVIVPLAITLLWRALRAANAIRRYLDDMLAAGAGIAGHTAAIPALDTTRGLAGGMVETADSIRARTAALAAVFAERGARSPPA